MKKKLIILSLLFSNFFSFGQGFIYDQQSSTDENGAFGGPVIQQFLSLGQSFTPALSSIGFVQLAFYDGNAGNNLGATIYLNLRMNSISGPILSSTTPVFMPDGFGLGGNSASITNFLFPISVGLIPGIAYYLELKVQSGDQWHTSASEYNTPGAHLIVNGQPSITSDLWFREGVIATPEPSVLALLIVGSGLAWFRQRRARL